MKTKHLRIIGETIWGTFCLAWFISFIAQAVFGRGAYCYIFDAICCVFEWLGISLEIAACRIEKKDRKDDAGNV